MCATINLDAHAIKTVLRHNCRRSKYTIISRRAQARSSKEIFSVVRSISICKLCRRVIACQRARARRATVWVSLFIEHIVTIRRLHTPASWAVPRQLKLKRHAIVSAKRCGHNSHTHTLYVLLAHATTTTTTAMPLPNDKIIESTQCAHIIQNTYNVPRTNKYDECSMFYDDKCSLLSQERLRV